MARRSPSASPPAAWRYAVGPTPQCGPADHQAARQFADRITRALDLGGWSKHERDKMYWFRGVWRRRAEGKDAWFELRGTKGGKLTIGEQAKVLLLEKMIAVGEEGRK